MPQFICFKGKLIFIVVCEVLEAPYITMKCDFFITPRPASTILPASNIKNGKNPTEPKIFTFSSHLYRKTGSQYLVSFVVK